ncbi:MAG TPA: ABC transporter ATP-binding protein [Bryobacteraceae bacterium]|jgi:ABC-2 type transport system ATP-binding protein|nr:ABC transporter ATP-binding protein [Bryobacteraceae bacterium]
MPADLAIETEGLSKTFRRRWSKQAFRAVENLSLRVERGTTYGLLGPNGAGKTTFVKMLLSCANPTSGRAKVFGIDSRIPAARRPIGYLPENHRFPTYMTGRGMLDFYSALSGMDGASRKKRTAELLTLVGLAEWGDVRLGKYSKGMLQRVGLAQALMHSPSLLILDEPSDGVDPVGRRQIREILQGLEEKGVTIFLNSHLLAEVELFCRDVAIIHRGKLALEGKIKDLTAGSGYRVEAEHAPERLVDELRAQSSAVSSQNGTVAFHFASREVANHAVDLLRAEKCEIEAVARTKSTLEEVFMRTVDGK